MNISGKKAVMSRNMHKYEELTPYEFNKEKERASIVYVAAGPLEYHEECNALGIDPCKGYQWCLDAAEITGGIVFPLLPIAPAGSFPSFTRKEIQKYYSQPLFDGKYKELTGMYPGIFFSRQVCRSVYQELLEAFALEMKFKLECGKYSDIENYVYAQNQIAKIIGEKHPEIKIDMLAYSNLFDCPDNLELEPNLFIDEAVTSATFKIRTSGKSDGTYLTESPYEENILKWKKTGATVVYYDYLMGTHSCRQRYIPEADEQQSNWKRCMEVGIAGSGT